MRGAGRRVDDEPDERPARRGLARPWPACDVASRRRGGDGRSRRGRRARSAGRASDARRSGAGPLRAAPDRAPRHRRSEPREVAPFRARQALDRGGACALRHSPSGDDGVARRWKAADNASDRLEATLRQLGKGRRPLRGRRRARVGGRPAPRSELVSSSRGGDSGGRATCRPRSQGADRRR